MGGVTRPWGQLRGSGVLFALGPLAGCDHEYAVAPEAQAHEAPVRLLANVPVHHHSVPGGVEVDDGGLGLGLREDRVKEPGDVGGEPGGLGVWVDTVGPVVLPTQGDPVKLAVEDLAEGLGPVDGGVLGVEGGGGGVWPVGEEGGTRIQGLVGDLEVEVHVCLVVGVAEITVDHEF